MPVSSDVTTTANVGTGKYSPTKDKISQISELGTFGKADYEKLATSFPSSPVMSDTPDDVFSTSDELFQFFMGIVFSRGADGAANVIGKDGYDPVGAGSDFTGNSILSANINDFGSTSGAPDISTGGFSETDQPADASTNPPPSSKFYPNLSSPANVLPADISVQSAAEDVYTETGRATKQFGTGLGSGNSPSTTSSNIADRIDTSTPS